MMAHDPAKSNSPLHQISYHLQCASWFNAHASVFWIIIWLVNQWEPFGDCNPSLHCLMFWPKQPPSRSRKRLVSHELREHDGTWWSILGLESPEMCQQTSAKKGWNNSWFSIFHHSFQEGNHQGNNWVSHGFTVQSESACLLGGASSQETALPALPRPANCSLERSWAVVRWSAQRRAWHGSAVG